MTTLATVDGPLLRTALGGHTDYWNDSCAVDELAYAIERGATGATSNPSIVLEVMRRDIGIWTARVRALALEHPHWSEVELAWAIVEEMAARGAALLAPVFEREHGAKGRLSVQVDPTRYRDPDRMVEQALRLAGIAPNIQVKFPVTAAGLIGLEEATALGVTVTATVAFTVGQAIAAAEAVERGLDRRAHTSPGGTAAMAPVCAIMVGRLDDWLKAIVERDDLAVDPNALDWAGIAVAKRAYEIYRQRGYRTRLLIAAYRHRLHWTEFVGGDLSMTIPHRWQLRFNASAIEPVARIDVPVDPAIVDELQTRLPDFRRAYEPDGLRPDEFEAFGATARTLRSFIAAYHDLLGAVRDAMLPNPDIRPG
jgi:transaldolase